VEDIWSIWKQRS